VWARREHSQALSGKAHVLNDRYHVKNTSSEKRLPIIG
jgi:hypothetical protein